MRAERTALPITAARRLGFVQRLIGIVDELWRLLMHRRALRQLDDLSDWELVDIGLTREDIAIAYETPIHEDPTRRLEQVARARARQEILIRRRP